MPKNREPPKNHSIRVVKNFVHAPESDLRVPRSYLKDPDKLRPVITRKAKELKHWKRSLTIAEEQQRKEVPDGKRQREWR
jgi:hypothetical protein